MSENKSFSDFTSLYDSMTECLYKKIPRVNKVAAYDPTDTENGGQRQSIKTPAILIELAEMKPASTISGGRQSFNCEFVLHCVLSIKTPNVQVEITNYAAAVSNAVFNNRWGFGGSVEKPTDISAYASTFKGGDKGFESWVVSYSQKVHIGDISTLAENLPSDVYVGESPNIGEKHQQDYTKVT